MELYIILGLIIGLYFIGIYIYSPSYKGKSLEKKINKILKELAMKFGGHEFWDYMFPIGSTTTQIDNILLTEKAIYVIEAKNYQGFIHGSSNQKEWTLTSKNSKTYRSSKGRKYTKTYINKNTFYNPIKQNNTHVDAILNIVNNNIPIINIVVFGKKVFFKQLNLSEKDNVVKIENLKTTIVNIDETMTKTLELDTMIETVENLYYENIINKKDRKKHVKSIMLRHNKN
jgi:hypothetical protein